MTPALAASGLRSARPFQAGHPGHAGHAGHARRRRIGGAPVPSPSRRGQVPLWIPVTLLLFGASWIVHALDEDVRATGFASVRPSTNALEGLSGFVDARWRPWLAAHLAALPPASAMDPDELRSIPGAVAGLPFVAEVGAPRVIWPDGCEFAVRLRAPVACVRSGEEYLAVSEDGVLLPGEWVRPPWIGGGWLPVIGPLDGAFDRARPGEVLARADHLDALEVARSMRAALEVADFEAAGPPLIDARAGRRASVEEPGVTLALEDGRLVLFGRPPHTGHPGELPVAAKWAALARALSYLRASEGEVRDWSVVDVRWDVPEIRWRSAAAGD